MGSKCKRTYASNILFFFFFLCCCGELGELHLGVQRCTSRWVKPKKGGYSRFSFTGRPPGASGSTKLPQQQPSVTHSRGRLSFYNLHSVAQTATCEQSSRNRECCVGLGPAWLSLVSLVPPWWPRGLSVAWPPGGPH